MSHISNAKTPRKFGRAFMAALLATTMLTTSFAAYMPAYAGQTMTPAAASIAPASFADVLAKTRPAVVSIIVKKADVASSIGSGKFDPNQLPEGLRKFFKQFGMPGGGQAPQQRQPRGGGGQKVMGQGSGFFISADGYVVTNNHVISGSDDITVMMTTGRKLKAKLIGTDPKTDLAVLKVSGHDFPHVAFGDSDKTRVGDWVVAVGNPFGLSGTTTAGIVSARGRDIGSGPYDDFIQIDAPINRGNSGGPSFNGRGQVIGVNTAIYSPSGGSVGIGFAIPSNVAKTVVASLMADGTVHRGWLGVSIQSITQDMSEALGLATTQGALIASVNPGSPAAKAGLRSGDIVTNVDDTAITSPRDLSRVIAGKGPAHSVALKLWRDGGMVTSTVLLKEQPGPQTASLGQNETTANGSKLGLMLKDTGDGVVIGQVAPDSPAAEKGLMAGDRIEQVSGRDVKSANDVKQAVEQAVSKGKSRVVMQIKSRNGSRFVALKLGKSTG